MDDSKSEREAEVKSYSQLGRKRPLVVQSNSREILQSVYLDASFCNIYLF